MRLNLKEEDEVRSAFQAIAKAVREEAREEVFDGCAVQPMIESDGYELILGSSFDDQFGPVILFGSGGALVEVYQDRALALPPLNGDLARQMIMRTRIYKALKGVRGRQPVDLHLLETIMVRFSQLIIEQSAVKELDINPLLAASGQVIALDARAILHEKDGQPLPKPAIRPYPSQYVKNWEMKDGTPVIVRPVRPEDEPLLVRFHQTLSDAGLNVLQPMQVSQQVVRGRFTRLCFKDYQNEMVFVIERQDRQTGERDILAVSQLNKSRRTNQARFSVLVGEQFQGFGLGSELLRQSIAFGEAEGVEQTVAYVSEDNAPMLHICKKFGFQTDRKDGRVQAFKDLS